MLQILGKQAARKDTKSMREMEGLEKILASFWDLPLGLVCWGADEPSYRIPWKHPHLVLVQIPPGTNFSPDFPDITRGLFAKPSLNK